MIHPLVLEGIPCFDLTPITGPALDAALPGGVGQTLSGLAGSHGVTGSVYKARERIHRGSADPRLLAIPASRGRIADPDPNWDRLWRLAPPRGVAARCACHCSTCVALGMGGVMT